MKIICSKADMMDGINIVSKAIPSKTTMSILECILIDSTNDEIKLTANNTELGIETIIDGDIIERGIVALDAKIFSEIVRKLPDNDILINSDDDYVTNIVCEKSRFNIVGKSGEEFTYLPEINKESSIAVSQLTLRNVIHQTLFCVAANNANPVMNGELFEIDNDRVKVTALDGHRIAMRNISLKEGNFKDKVIIPGSTLSELAKIITGDIEDIVNIYFSSNNVQFEFGNTKVLSRIIEGEFFDVNQMMNADYSINVKVARKELLDCLDRASLLVRDGDKRPIIVNITDSVMELKINSALGSLNETIDVEKDGSDIMIGFNPKFMMDALRVIDEEYINLVLLNPKAPCFIKDDEDTFNYLVLPINFNTVR